MKNAFTRQLMQMAATDSNVMLLTGDLGFGAFEPFQKQFPKQFLNIGIAEQNMIGIATGLALGGKKVFTYSIANFGTFRCLEQIRNDASYHNANVTVVSVGAGFSYGALGISHHATEDIAILRALPDVDVVVPADDWEASEATKALAETKGTSFLRLDRAPIEKYDCKNTAFELGKARVLREGKAMTLVATGGITCVALKAADELYQQGIACRVLSLHSIRPLDEKAILNAAIETGGVITIEEHSIHGGLGGIVSETLMEAMVTPNFFTRIGLRAGFSSVVGSQDYLRTLYKMDKDSIMAAVKKGIRYSDQSDKKLSKVQSPEITI